MRQDRNTIHKNIIYLKLKWLRMPEKDVNIVLGNWLENSNSSVRDLKVDIQEWLRNVERQMLIVDGKVFQRD